MLFRAIHPCVFFPPCPKSVLKFSSVTSIYLSRTRVTIAMQPPPPERSTCFTPPYLFAANCLQIAPPYPARTLLSFDVLLSVRFSLCLAQGGRRLSCDELHLLSLFYEVVETAGLFSLAARCLRRFEDLLALLVITLSALDSVPPLSTFLDSTPFLFRSEPGRALEKFVFTHRSGFRSKPPSFRQIWFSSPVFSTPMASK